MQGIVITVKGLTTLVEKSTTPVMRAGSLMPTGLTSSADPLRTLLGEALVQEYEANADKVARPIAAVIAAKASTMRGKAVPHHRFCSSSSRRQLGGDQAEGQERGQQGGRGHGGSDALNSRRTYRQRAGSQ